MDSLILQWINTGEKNGLVIRPPHYSFPSGSDGKASTCNVIDLGSIPGSGRSPGGGNGNPLQYSCLGKSHGQGSLVDDSPLLSPLLPSSVTNF